MNFFLRAKHWQLVLIGFLTMILIPIMAGILVVFVHNMRLALMMYPVIFVGLIALTFGWLYSVGTNLHSKLPSTVSMSLKRFKLFLSIPLIYFIIVMIFITWALSTFQMPNSIAQRYGPVHINFTGFDFIKDYLAFLIPIHLFSIYCIFYCMYFVAKTLRAVELQRPVRTSDYIGEFLMLWISIIGIWFIQPRINKIFGYKRDDANSLDDHMTLT